MLKEIYEQPTAIGDTLATLLDDSGRITTPPLPFDWRSVDRLTILACGTAYHAGLVAKYWFEHIARIPCEVDIASEFRYRAPPMPQRGAVIALSQSGETADTLAAVQYAKDQGQPVLAVVNVPSSSLARMADAIIPTIAGPEVSVASTKAYTTQLTVMLALALAAGIARGTISDAAVRAATEALQAVPGTLTTLLQADAPWGTLASTLARADEIICLGRGLMFPLALEGALKLKEITYIPAEGYAAGEMKHGPIALIDDGTPVIVLAPTDALFDKTASNIAEIRARGAQVIVLSDADGLQRLGATGAGSGIAMPAMHPAVMPLLYVVPLQLLAYHAAVARGTDVDQPRNLAKSVVVE
jgi:glucosamine--fructose-6-phosphate aminotransferase (isomerizing)